jgi:hypothetical protein
MLAAGPMISCVEKGKTKKQGNRFTALLGWAKKKEARNFPTSEPTGSQPDE